MKLHGESSFMKIRSWKICNPFFQAEICIFACDCFVTNKSFDQVITFLITVVRWSDVYLNIAREMGKNYFSNKFSYSDMIAHLL